MLVRRLPRSSSAFAATFALAAALAAAAPDTAGAHAYLVRSDPEGGARLDRSPRVVLLYFSEPFVAGSERISVRRLGGEKLALPPPVRRGTVIRQSLPADLRGVIVVNWAVLADDGHPSLGELAFAAGTGAAVPQLAARQQQQTPWAQSAAAWLFFVGLALALGGLVSERVVWRGRDVAGPPIGLGLLVAANGAAIYLVDIAAERAGSLSALTSPSDVLLALETRPGRLTLAMLALLGLAVVAVVSRGRLLAIPALLAAATVSAVRGHSGTSGHWWAVPADALHLAAAAVWIGALVHLVRVVYAAHAHDRRETLARGARRYASLAFMTVLVSIAAGLVTALAQFGSLDQLLETGYGQTLLVKVALIAVALGVALAARTRALCLPWPEKGLLRRVGTFELTSGAVGLLLLALLVGSSPMRLVSSVLFAGTLVVCAVALRHAVLASAGEGTALVVAGLSGVVAVNAGIVATGAAIFRDGLSAGGNAVLVGRLALGAAAGALAVAAITRALSHGGVVRLPLLRRLTTTETVALVGALAAAALLVSLAPPRGAEALAARAALGPPPITGPAVRLGAFAGQMTVGVTATDGLLRFEIVVPSQRPVENLRLTAETQPPRGLSADLYPRPCGDGCFTIRYRLPRGRTVVTAEVSAPGFEGGRVRFVIPWPPPPERPQLLARVARTMFAVPDLELTELVVSGSTSSRTPARYRLPGKELLRKAEMYRGGAVDVRVLGRRGRLTELAFALPASKIWYRMWIDETYRVRREVIINRGHLITRTLEYPPR